MTYKPKQRFICFQTNIWMYLFPHRRKSKRWWVALSGYYKLDITTICIHLVLNTYLFEYWYFVMIMDTPYQKFSESQLRSSVNLKYVEEALLDKFLKCHQNILKTQKLIWLFSYKSFQILLNSTQANKNIIFSDFAVAHQTLAYSIGFTEIL